MKKTLALIAIFFLLSVTPARAFNLIDFLFPPVQMQPSTRDTPGPALAPEVPSNDTYSNTLKENTVDCNGAVPLSNTWDPVKKATGTTNANGEAVEEYVPYDAKDLTGELDVKNLSNNYYRNFELFFAKGGVKCTEERLRQSINDLSASGSNASNRAIPREQLLVAKSKLLSDVALSLNQKDKVDTVAQDFQITWSCSGTCQELTNTSAANCRPVYLSEVIYGLQGEDLYYSSPTSPPSKFPGSVLKAVNSHYGNNCSSDYGCYSSRSKGKSFSPLSKKDYLLFYKQISASPKGNVDNKITVINWDGYDTAAQRKINPTPTVFHRNLPNAAPAYYGNAQLLGYVSPQKQTNLPNADMCNSVETTSTVAIDQPLPALIALFVHGIFQHVPAGESYSHSENIEVTSTYENQVVSNTQIAEKAYSNMIPNASLKNENLIDQKFSSKTTANDGSPIVDPANRADKLLNKMTRMLRPASWF